MSRAGADQPEPLCSGARGLALFLTPEPGSEAKEVEEAIKGMLLRLEEICSRAGMIRSDTSQILEENIPLLQAKVADMLASAPEWTSWDLPRPSPEEPVMAGGLLDKPGPLPPFRILSHICTGPFAE
uniref:Breast carcinoma amplified sequence 4 n=1 Tax=Pipistrellus kuhlii TaxID=59472 RepID=A0A7J7Y8R2_PIPKU|nr:breast carcinoma amplified sequence 4 [Pipistrellus kuhlii]